MSTNIILLKSDLFGVDEFDYPTLKEAKKGFNRLVKSCRIHWLNDRIDRELVLLRNGSEISKVKFITNEH